MKKGKTGRRMLSAVIASVMLLSSMTVFAVEKPALAEYLQDDDEGTGLSSYMEALDNAQVEYVDTANGGNVETAKQYFASGKLIGDLSKKEAVDNGWGNGFDAQYAAIQSLDQSIVVADGTRYIPEELYRELDTIWDKFTILDGKLESNSIIQVSDEASAPDVATMDKGVYWVLESDVTTYFSDRDELANTENGWRNGEDWKKVTIQMAWGEFETDDLVYADFSKLIDDYETVYNTILGKLHEGTKETAKPVESLTAVTPSANKPQTQEEPAPVLVNEVIASNGTKTQSKMEGVYGRTVVAGAVYTDEQTKIKQAAGLTEEEIKNGVVVKYYICNSSNKTVNEQLSESLTEQGYKVLGVINNDLYKLNKGKISKIKTTEGALTLTIGVPENFRSEKFEFIIMCYDEKGNLVIMQDLDADKSTITVQGNSFGYWAIGYRAK
ncbi:MAG: hypothetical protein PUG54_06750 [Firmicutes bacterium]|nr:hypothetical protein [Bacillota bacterium]